MTTGGRLAYHVVDVFTDRPFAGNPLAVVLDGERLSTAQMQAIATEFGLSETAFPLRPTAAEVADGADYRVRIFTPDSELPFAGHPSIGTAWLLHRLGWFDIGRRRQLCGEGLLPITVFADGATLTGGAPRVGDPIDAAGALEAVGLSPEDLRGEPVRVASTGLAYAVLPVKSSGLAQCEPDVTRLRRDFSFPQDASGVYVVAWDSSPLTVRARMFAGDIGSPEDAATGSGALAYGAFLAASGLLPDGTSSIEITQGVEMGRPSLLRVECDVREGVARQLRVAGSVVPLAEGELVVPGISAG